MINKNNNIQNNEEQKKNFPINLPNINNRNNQYINSSNYNNNQQNQVVNVPYTNSNYGYMVAHL